MDSKAEMYFKRAESELETAEILRKISAEKDAKQDFNIPQDATYYSGVISHSYYAIFYSAKAMLLTKRVETKAPEVHKKTLESFKENFIDSGLLDARLLEIYRKMIIRAETLLEIFRTEKRRRGEFTYNTIPQANAAPAAESVSNAKEFMKHCNTYLSNT